VVQRGAKSIYNLPLPSFITTILTSSSLTSDIEDRITCASHTVQIRFIMAEVTSVSDGRTKDAVNIVEYQENVENGAPTTAKDVVADAADKGQGLTGYESLTWWQTVLKFKISSLVCFMVAISGGTDGYQIG
jgi:hypothetical protein